jgi:hypothetical protein
MENFLDLNNIEDILYIMAFHLPPSPIRSSPCSWLPNRFLLIVGFMSFTLPEWPMFGLKDIMLVLLISNPELISQVSSPAAFYTMSILFHQAATFKPRTFHHISLQPFHHQGSLGFLR